MQDQPPGSSLLARLLVSQPMGELRSIRSELVRDLSAARDEAKRPVREGAHQFRVAFKKRAEVDWHVPRDQVQKGVAVAIDPNRLALSIAFRARSLPHPNRA